MNGTQVTITTRNVGQAFGCEAVVRYASNGKTIHTTSVRPFGFDGAAYAAAKAWAERQGYVVRGEGAQS